MQISHDFIAAKTYPNHHIDLTALLNQCTWLMHTNKQRRITTMFLLPE